ncbi:hypothetical protein E2C01_044142 [Portunus trituberculatus]|uniref:Uncharacterized protein n=1 Tax=Portunus trituberculatus TaxID=210409 RepID=A0A5B7FY20_PORTR|nr:hypothetical protein [Portunus trituberculatus]
MLDVEKKSDAILKHINRFPRIELHSTHQDSNCDYLHPNLNKQKIYFAVHNENENIQPYR